MTSAIVMSDFFVRILSFSIKAVLSKQLYQNG
jgi:hypothetical protein